VALTLSASAQAAPVTIGSPLTAKFTSSEANITATVFNLVLPEADARLVSPVTGAIVHWKTLDASGAVTLRVLRPVGGTTYKAVGTSAVEAPSGGLQTYATALPIQAGDAIGLDVTKTTELGVAEQPGAQYGGWIPPILEGNSEPYITEPSAMFELGFNAEVQPAPTITALKPASGSITGGTSVTITGTDFEGTTAVSFGATPAKSFTVASEGQITAMAPASKTLAKVPLTVTTIAGTATSPSTFSYSGCKVPKLSGKTLKVAKKKLKKADCKLGKVTKLKGASAKTAKVTKQSLKPSKVLAPGAKVNLKLGK
jgi:hypothetical protein